MVDSLRTLTSLVQRAFLIRGQVNKLIVLLWLVVNTIVLSNAVRYSPYLGYDSGDHQKYIASLATGHLPRADESREFFSPPLPYVIPASLIGLLRFDPYRAGKVAQFINFLLSIATTLLLLLLCDLVNPDANWLKPIALLFLGMVPVYYKTFAMIRGEPYVVFFTLLVLYLTLRAQLFRCYTRTNAILLGVTLGLLILSRQWGFLIFPALIVGAIFWSIKETSQSRTILVSTVSSMIIAFVVGGWFYLNLLSTYGSITAFNRTLSASFSVTNQPLSFYIGTGNGNLFSHPVDRAFPNQLLPIFHSETWGDYWGFFLVAGKDTRTGTAVSGPDLVALVGQSPRPNWLETNADSIATYLGMLNLTALLPTLLAIVSLLYGAITIVKVIRHSTPSSQDNAVAFITLIIISSLAGYVWFLIMNPNPIGDTIKATYMLHLFPVMAFLMAAVVQKLFTVSKSAFVVLMGSVIIVVIVAFLAMLTRY